MALALYRRYRPDTFDGVIGQDQVTIPLMRALDAGKLTHAYLFSGPRGCGKTSSARILARCINCAKGPTSHPCGECDSCRDLATGGPGSIDVVEIDAASHNGVDDARELRERAGFAPARDRYKIFILDEAHMVTQQGFNALLKIVEEPPEHVMFIFATTEPDKVIGTIRSRTHHYPFRLVPAEIMGPYLETICEKESIKPEPGVLKLAMRAGGGSVRDTLSVLDQLMVGSVDGVISHDSAVALLGFTPETLIGEAIDAVIDRDGEALYGVIQKVVVGGFDPRRFVEDLLARVRDLLVLTLAGERAETVMSDTAEGEDMTVLNRQAGALGLASLTAMADTINTTLSAMTGAISPRMRLELLAARLLANREGAAPIAVADNGAGAKSGVQATSGNNHVGFAGAARNQRTVSEPRTGFIGSARNNPVSEPVTSSNDSSSPASHQKTEHTGVNAPSANAVGATDSTAHAASNTAPIQAAAEPDAATGQPSAMPAVERHADDKPDTRTPDQKWDALVVSLPAGVQRYVNRTRIPKILLAADQTHPGHMRLWLKFDRSLSKYAFALAVADEAVDGTTNVVSILRNEVRHMFGANVAIAPTNKMADGSVAPPFSKLPQDQQQKIKAQLLQESLQAAVAKSAPEPSSGATSGDREGESSATETTVRSDDDEAHRAGAAASDDADPWAQPQSSSAGDVAAAADDPWAQPDGTVRPLQRSSAPNRHPQAEHHRKHVAVPDPHDDTDPWAVPPTQQQWHADDGGRGAAAGTPSVPGVRSGEHRDERGDDDVHASAENAYDGMPDDPWDQSIPLPDAAPPDDDPWANQSAAPVSQLAAPFGGKRHDAAGIAPHAAPDPWANPAVAVASGVAASGVATPGVATGASPQVDPDEDEYSMDDASLGAGGMMSVEDLTKFFEAKKVEEFAADDPKNPRNIARNAKHDE